VHREDAPSSKLADGPFDIQCYICYNGRMMTQMTRIVISETVWRKFRALAVERGLSTPELLGSVVSGYVIRASSRRVRVALDKRSGPT
jgi:hypothetical protein